MTIEDAKAVVRRFNQQVIAEGDRASFDALMAPDFVNHSAPAGAPADAESLWRTFDTILRPALGTLTVTIHDQLGERDRVVTRKTISGTHVGALFEVPATGRPVGIDVIDIVRVVDGRYAEHWGINTLPAVLASLRG